MADWRCPRSRVWNYEYKGVGITRQETGVELFLGTALHDGLAAIATQHQKGRVDIDQIVTTIQKQVCDSLVEAGQPGDPDAEYYAKEQAALVEGLLRGFYKTVWPRLIAQYPKILAVEQEMLFRHNHMGKPDPLGPYAFMAKPDLVVEDHDGQAFYIEHKSTSSKKDEWINSWNTAIQLHATIRAIEQTLNREVAGVIVQGFYKGFYSYGKQSSPFCYCYKKSGNPPFTEDQVAYEYKPGFKRYPTWELPGGTKDWVLGMPDDILGGQFPQTPPIYTNSTMIDAFFAQAAIREVEIREAMKIIDAEETSPEERQRLLDGYFPQHFQECSPAWGRPCNYRPLCHGGAGDDPLEAGFQLRDTSHEAGFKSE